VQRRAFLGSTLAASILAGLGAPLGGAARAASQTATVPRRALGRTGVEVSIVGVGGAHLAGGPSRAESIRIVRTALDAGVDFLDNSWDYHDGESERRMGEALQGGYRDRAFLMTKIDGRTKTEAARQIDESLRRLRVERIDLLQFHEIIRMDDPDRIFGEGGAIEAAEAARRAGKVRFLGFTGHKDPAIHLKMLEVARAHGFVPDTVQMPLNVLDAHYRSFERQVLPRLVEKGIGVIGMKPLAAGDALKSGVSAVDCLRYAMSLPVSTTVTGCDSLKILMQAIDLAKTFRPMSDDEKRALLARTRGAAAGGGLERFKTSGTFDSTAKHPEWLG
jgi:aryl-alcohol dehydrogenase-like predicted oxidoreductase